MRSTFITESEHFPIRNNPGDGLYTAIFLNVPLSNNPIFDILATPISSVKSSTISLHCKVLSDCLTGLIGEATADKAGLMPASLASKLQYYNSMPYIGSGANYLRITFKESIRNSILVNLTENAIKSTILHIGNSSAAGVISAKFIGLNTATHYKLYTKVVDGVRTIILSGIVAYSNLTILPLIGDVTSRSVSTTEPSDLAEYTECEIVT